MEETRLSLTAYQMQLDIERSHFDELIKEERTLQESLQTQKKDLRTKMTLLEEKLKECEHELREKNKKDAETSCSSRHTSFHAEGPSEKKKSIFGARADSQDPRDLESDYTIRDEKPDSPEKVERPDEDEQDLEDLVDSITGDASSAKQDLFIPRIRPMAPSEMDEYHEFNVSMIRAKQVNPLNESVIVFDHQEQAETINASLSELLRYFD